MADTRRKDRNWVVTDDSTGDGADKVSSWAQVQLAVMMDIRDELKRLNSLLYCPHFTGIPHTLTVIRKNTTKKRKAAR